MSSDEILEFWFGTAEDDLSADREKSSIWWSKNANTDAAIRVRFEPSIIAAASGKLENWRASTEGRLALILLTDQFPRNVYRGTPAAFRCDGIARQLCLDGLASRMDKELRLIQRVFFYMPLEHSEELEHQVLSVQLFRELSGEAPAHAKALFEKHASYAVGHHTIIERFGRFPHRNELLGRHSSREEIEFLHQPNSSY